MISRDDYFRGRDVNSPHYTSEIESNARLTVARVNLLLEHFGEQRGVNSGWRTPAINAATPGAAVRSKHLTAQACDLADPDGDLDDWCMDHLEVLDAIWLWLEHPAATKGWCHVQTIPPKSGKRVFYP